MYVFDLSSLDALYRLGAVSCSLWCEFVLAYL